MSSGLNRVVITGIGAISPAGLTTRDFFEMLESGRSTTRRSRLVHDPQIEAQVTAEVPLFEPARYIDVADLKRVPRVVPMAIGAAREAFANAGIDVEKLDMEAARSIGVIVGTGGGGIDFAENQYREFFENKNLKLTPYCVSSSFVGMLSSEISIALGLRGMSHVISTGCTSSTDALGYAYELIRVGRESMLLAGGAEACITRGLLAGFSRMKAVSTCYNDTPEKASRPFDKKRDGFVLAEGAWMFILESESRAKARGARIIGEVAGYASTCDAYHRVAMRADAMEPARAMSLAIERSGLSPEDIQTVQLHGTATVMNDTVETLAVKHVFGKRASSMPLTALKSMIGHPQGASGAAGVMAGIYTLMKNYIPPTINYENPDPQCDLNYTPNKGILKEVENVLCNTIAFGSKNSTLVLRRWHENGN